MEDYMTESPRQKITSSAVVIVLILVVMDGGMVAAVKLGLTDVPPLRYGAVRASILIVCLLPWMVLHAPWRVIAEHFAMIWPVSLVMTANAAGFLVGLGGGTSVARATIIANLQPMMVAIGAHLWLREDRTTRTGTIGMNCRAYRRDQRAGGQSRLEGILHLGRRCDLGGSCCRLELSGVAGKTGAGGRLSGGC